MECEVLLQRYKDSAAGSYSESHTTSWQPTILRTALYWVITQRVVVISYRRFGSGPIGCTETSVRNYHYSLRNNTEEHSYHLLRGGSLKSHNLTS